MFKTVNRRTDLINLIVARGAARREQLQTQSVQELEEILDKSLLAQITAEAAQSPPVLEAQRRLAEIQADRKRQSEEYQFVVIFRTPVNGKVTIDCQSNRNIIRSWLDESKGDTAINVPWFQKVLKETPSLAKSLTWQSADVLDPAKRRQAEAAQADEDRKTFNSFARANGYSEVEANFRLTVETLGSDFNEYQLSQAVQSNALALAPASPEELARFSQEAYEERVDFLTNRATPAELRAAAKAEAEQLSVRFQRQAQMNQIKTRQQAEAGQHPVLPETNQSGVKLDAAFFKNLADTNINLFKQYCAKYGFAAITARLNGVR